MKWQLPNVGSIRIIKKFAWGPTQLEDRSVVWLTTYNAIQQYTHFRGHWEYPSSERWITIARTH